MPRHLPKPSAEIVFAVLRALSVCVPVALYDSPAALAQAVAPRALTADIPAQPLAQALTAFARQSGLQLAYVSGIVRDHKSHVVSAGLSLDAALAVLLQGTGLKFEYLTAHSIRILATTPSPQTSTAVPRADEPYEVIITANRREETFQDVPITIQTLTGDQLNQLSVRSLNDLLRYTPNVTFSGNGPGTGSIFIRGLGYVGGGNQSQATTAPFPNVALYLDDQSMQFPSRNNDVYLVDMARVEVLEGPQGTLLGGGAQAGAIRYITNRPKGDAVSGEVNAAYGITAGGDPNTTLSAVLNVPFGGSFALRAVVFSEHRGGYIDNVSSTIGYVPGTPPHDLGGNPSANNGPLVGNNTNPVDYHGLRLSALWTMSDSWDLLLQQNYQNMEADGYFYSYPVAPNGDALGNYQIAAFSPAYTKDRYASTAWTLNGRLGDMVKLVYTGSYMDRHIEGQQDYSNYLRGLVASSYYACIGTGAGYFNPTTFPGPYPGLDGKPLQCSPPVANWHDTVRNTHHSEELRVSSNDSYRLRGVFGAFWEKFVIYDDMNFNYLGIPQCDPANLAAAAVGGPSCVSAVGPVPGSFANDPTLRENANTAFGEDIQRGYKQTAFFGSVDFDIIPKILTITGGTRYYNYDEFEAGSEYYGQTGSALIVNHANGACTAAGACGFPIDLKKSESGFSSRANLTWHITPDIMTYYTFSQGFRAGGFNRTWAVPGTQTPLHGPIAPYCGAASVDSRCLTGGSLSHLPTFQAQRPAGYESDDLINNEVGFKSELLNHRVLVNASAYQMRLNGSQSQLYDREHLGGLTWVVNGSNYTIKGVELQLIARVTEGLTFHGSSAWNSTSQSTSPCLRSVGIAPGTPHNPTPAGECITVIAGLPYTTPWGAPGTSAPYAPPLMFNLRARYDWSTNTFRPFVMLSLSHIGSMSSAPASFPDGNAPGQNPPTTTFLKYTIPAYTTYDAALGVVKDNWTAQITGTNLLNMYAATNVSAGQYIKAAIPLRPRVLMAQLAFSF